jgi:hypothetical protein
MRGNLVHALDSAIAEKNVAFVYPGPVRCRRLWAGTNQQLRRTRPHCANRGSPQGAFGGNYRQGDRRAETLENPSDEKVAGASSGS